MIAGGIIKRILIIEDDKSLAQGIKLALQNNELEINEVHNLKAAENEFENGKYELLILDVNLPDGNGINFLKKIREKSNVSVILLTVNDMEIDIVTGLESGADDYITKPFSLAVLRARVNTQLRKNKVLEEERIEIDNFVFDFGSMKFTKNFQPVELSKTEQKLLKILIVNKGNILTRAQLIDKVWNGDSEYVDENALSVTIKRLRNKIENNPSKPEYIKTVYGIGYMWAVK